MPQSARSAWVRNIHDHHGSSRGWSFQLERFGRPPSTQGRIPVYNINTSLGPATALVCCTNEKPTRQRHPILVPSDVAKQFAHRTDNIEDIATTTFLLEHNMLEQIFGESSMREYGAWVSNRACEIPWNAVFDLQTRTAHRSILGHEKSTNGLVEVGSGACGHKPSYRNIPHHARLQTQPTTSMNYFREVVDHHT